MGTTQADPTPLYLYLLSERNALQCQRAAGSVLGFHRLTCRDRFGVASTRRMLTLTLFDLLVEIDLELLPLAEC